MATGVGRGRTCLTSFSSPTPKTPYYAQGAINCCCFSASNLNSNSTVSQRSR